MFMSLMSFFFFLLPLSSSRLEDPEGDVCDDGPADPPGDVNSYKDLYAPLSVCVDCIDRSRLAPSTTTAAPSTIHLLPEYERGDRTEEGDDDDDDNGSVDEEDMMMNGFRRAASEHELP
jgi:hypothetical protein